MKVSMILNKNNSSRLKSLARFRKSLNTSRALQETKLAEGVEGIDRYVEDVIYLLANANLSFTQ